MSANLLKIRDDLCVAIAFLDCVGMAAHDLERGSEREPICAVIGETGDRLRAIRTAIDALRAAGAAEGSS